MVPEDRPITYLSKLLWAAVIGLLLAAVGLGMWGAPAVALQYWYLLTVPLIVAALRFGRRGALVVSGISILVLIAVFYASGEVFNEATAFMNSLIEASRSPQESARLAMQLADLRAADPTTTFARALLGMVLSIVSAVMLGHSVDNRARATRLLTTVYRRLSQYCPPQIVRALADQQKDGNPEIASVRKEITVLFADLRGFTTISERLDPEDIAGLLNEFFTAMTEELLREEGCLDKYIGDEIMAFFGDPIEHPDDVQRAFRAALSMQRRMRELNSGWESQGREPVGLGIGIATGHATVGITGSPTRKEYTALGSIVNVASRLGDLALPGQILTTRKTFWRVQDLVDGISRGPTAIKGFSQPVELISILGERATHREAEAATISKRWTGIITRVVNDSAYRGLLLWNPNEARALHSLDEDELPLAQRVAILSGHPIFREVPAEEIAALMAASSIEEYPEGAVVVQQGAQEDRFYILLRGDVVIAVKDEQNLERHVASLSGGDHFGEVALLFDTPRTATVRTVSRSTVLVLHRDGFYSVLSRAPALRRNIETTGRNRMARPFPLRAPESTTAVEGNAGAGVSF